METMCYIGLDVHKRKSLYTRSSEARQGELLSS